MDIATLTTAQRTVFYLLIQGKSNGEISRATCLKEKTVKAHVTEILKKLKCKSRAQLIAKHYMAQLKDMGAA